MRTTVSVIVVNYNQGRFIAQAIDSVLKQTFNDFEIIIVDDGSQDDSFEIINRIRDNCPNKIRFLFHNNNQNLGIQCTYKMGILSAKSKYLAFLEADDQWEINYLKRKVEVLDRYPEVGVVFSKYKIIPENWYGYDMAFRQWVVGLSIPKNRPFQNLNNLLKKNNITTFSAFMTRSSLLENLTMDCDRSVLFYDWWILAQLAMRSKFYMDNTSFVLWRQHKESTLGKQKFEVHKKMLSVFMGMLYEKVGQEIALLDARQRRNYIGRNSILPFFNRFYRNPDIRNFLAFFRIDPFWATESLISYLINSWKYS